MNNFRFGRLAVLSVFILLVNIINCGYSTTVPNKDDTFAINVTMKNFQTGQVYTIQKSNYLYSVFLLGR
jgi:hypothetical protein